MNKDMINIDDFVREKLGSREEREDPAAWLRMKALLDKEMPEKVIPLGFRFGKAAAILGCALLAALLGVGGYKVLHNTTDNTPATATVSPAHSGTTGTTGVNSSKSGSSTATEYSPAANTAANSAATTAPGNTSGSADNNGTANTPEHTNRHNNNTAAASHSTAAAGHSTSAKNTATANGNNGTTGKDNSANSGQNTVAANNTPNNTADHSNNSTKKDRQYNSGTAARLSHAKTGTATAANTASTNTVATGHTNTKPNAATAKLKPASGHNTKATAANRPAATTAGNSKAATATDPKGKENNGNNTAAATGTQSTKDSMVAVGLTQRAATSGPLPRKVSYTTDSTSLGKIAVAENKNTPAPEQPLADPNPGKQTMKTMDPRTRNPRYLGANPPQVKPAAAAPAESPASPAAGTTTASAEVVKKKEKREFFGFIKNIHFDEIVDNVKYDIGHAQFYMGVGGGLNYSPSGSNSFRGAQFGATGELVFNKHLSLMGELKYFNRSGSNKVVDDSYIDQHTTSIYDSLNSKGYWYTVTTDSTNHYFNFSTLHSFEMPITLRYAFNKFYLMTGINVAYYLGLNVEEISNPKGAISSNPTAYQNSKAPELTREQPQLNVTDFGTRYGIGYIFGAGYQINPSTQIDLRMVSTFWDNAKSDGAKQISKDFYRIPSVQINLNYQFNRGNKNRTSFGPNGQ